jgi:hypothetical protein
MTIRRDENQALSFRNEQDAIQVVPDVMHCHCEVHLVHQCLERGLGNTEYRPEIGCFLNQRKVVTRKRLQSKSALPALQRQLVLRARQ